LRPAAEGHERTNVWPIHSAIESPGLATSLLTLWRDKSPPAANKVLACPDVRVTNEQDKTLQLPKIEELDGFVKGLDYSAEAAMAAAKAAKDEVEELAALASAHMTKGKSGQIWPVG